MPLAVLADPWQRVQVREEEVSRGLTSLFLFKSNFKLSVIQLTR